MIPIHLPCGIRHQPEVGEVHLSLLEKAAPLLPGHWRQVPVLDRIRPLPVARQHRINIELSHGDEVTG